eukprot:sb/3464191/
MGWRVRTGTPGCTLIQNFADFIIFNSFCFCRFALFYFTVFLAWVSTDTRTSITHERRPCFQLFKKEKQLAYATGPFISCGVARQCKRGDCSAFQEKQKNDRNKKEKKLKSSPKCYAHPGMILLLVTSWISLSGAYTFLDPSIYEPGLDTYFHNEFIGETLDFLQSEYPDIVQTTSLGETVNGREIHAVTITKNVSYWQTHNRPSVKYVGNMHGNEIRGRGLLMKLAYYLAAQYSVDEDVKHIVDSTIFHLVPTINPDGFASAVPTCSGVTGRYTSQGVDMNRDFPNHWSTGEKMKYAAETLLVMDYAKTITPVLGISFHDGALVTNYPWDGQPDLYTGQYAKSPDDALFIELAKSYTFAHASMYDTSKQCANDNFKDGITNGNMWYKVFNGMQDWNYVDMDCFEVTIELGCCKYPSDPKSTYKAVWLDNFRSVFEFTAKAHQTIRGKVASWDGSPILGLYLCYIYISVLDGPHQSMDRYGWIISLTNR